jgi:hypothetical protein
MSRVMAIEKPPLFDLILGKSKPGSPPPATSFNFAFTRWHAEQVLVEVDNVRRWASQQSPSSTFNVQ